MTGTIGIILLILGFFLIPFLVGFPIMIAGILLVVYDAHRRILGKIPGGDRLLNEYKKLFGTMFGFISALVRELFGKNKSS